MSGLYSELKRRNVFRVAIAYVLLAWVVLQIADVLFPALTLPDWTVRFVAGLLILGFPLAIFFAWAFELTPEGIRREHEVSREESISHETRRKLDVVLIGVLAIAVTLFALDKFVWQPGDSVTASRSGDNSIAVLPFVNMSDDPANEYFSDGMSEELLNLLAKIPELRVIGRTSSFQFKGKNEDLRIIGEMLGTANILEGSVRKSGNQVRITAQLISAQDGTHLWSETFDRNLDDVFKVQDEIAAAVVAALRTELLGDSMPSRSTPVVTEAYDEYLKGLYFARRLNEEDLMQALVHFEAARNLDPNMAAAWEMIGSVYLNQTLNGVLPLEQGQQMSLQALDRAIELNPMASGALYQSGFRKMAFDWDWAGAEELFRNALEVEPNHAGALSGLGLLSLAMGRYDEAIQLQKLSIQADPLRATSQQNLAFTYYKAGKLDLAEPALRAALETTPNMVRGQYRYALALLAQGNLESALRHAEMEMGEHWRLAALAMIYREMGRDTEADAALAALVDEYSDDAAFAISKAYANRGDADSAFNWLDVAYDQHDPLVPWIRSDPQFVEIKDDPRFGAFLRRLNLPE